MLVDKYPQATEAPAAAWAAGKLYEQAALWDQAARFYQTLADRYPKDQHAADALFNAGLLREHLGDTQGAIAAYTRVRASATRRARTSSEVAFRVGVVYAEAGQHEAAARAFGDYARKYPGSAQTIEALLAPGRGAHRGRAGQARRRSRSRRRWRSTSAAATRRRPARRRTRATSRARSSSATSSASSWPSDPQQAQAHARREVEAAREGQAGLRRRGHLQRSRVGDGGAVSASATPTSASPRRCATRRCPPELNAEEQQVYRDELEKVVVVVEEKAIDAYKGGYQKALQLGVYNEFTQKLRAGARAAERPGVPGRERGARAPGGGRAAHRTCRSCRRCSDEARAPSARAASLRSAAGRRAQAGARCPSCRRPSRRRSRRSRTRRAWCASAPGNYERALERLEGRRRDRSQPVGGLVRRRLARARAPSHRRGDRRAREGARDPADARARPCEALGAGLRAGGPPGRRRARCYARFLDKQPNAKEADAVRVQLANALRRAGKLDEAHRDAARGRCASSRARRRRSTRSAWSTRRTGSTSSPTWCCTARSTSTRSPRPPPTSATTSAWSRWRGGAIRRRSPTSTQAVAARPDADGGAAQQGDGLPRLRRLRARRRGAARRSPRPTRPTSRRGSRSAWPSAARASSTRRSRPTRRRSRSIRTGPAPPTRCSTSASCTWTSRRSRPRRARGSTSILKVAAAKPSAARRRRGAHAGACQSSAPAPAQSKPEQANGGSS